MDEFDRASEIEQAQRDASIAAVRVEAPPTWWDGVHCIDPECDDEVPPARRKLGLSRCIECQQRLENKR